MTYHLLWSDLITRKMGIEIATVSAPDKATAVAKLIKDKGLSALQGWTGLGGIAVGGGFVYTLKETT